MTVQGAVRLLERQWDATAALHMAVLLSGPSDPGESMREENRIGIVDRAEENEAGWGGWVRSEKGTGSSVVASVES